jgi:transcriptional repressor NrdR
VPSTAIGEEVLKQLKELDQVAYIRFASVYRQFADLDDLRREIADLGEGESIDSKERQAPIGS